MNESPIAPPSAFCSQCGRSFQVEDLMQYGDTYVCSDCKPAFLQRVREGSAVTTGVALHYASVWARLGALIVDGLILSAVQLVAGFIMGFAGNTLVQPSGFGFGYAGAPYTVIGFIIGITYEVVFLANSGATPGKMAFGLKVVTPDGGPISYGRAFGRYFARLLSSFTLLIGYIIAFFDSEKRALHDRICSTRVISTR